MSKTLFYWITIGGCMLFAFGTGPLLQKIGLMWAEGVSEKVAGALTAIYFCVCIFLYFSIPH